MNDFVAVLVNEDHRLYEKPNETYRGITLLVGDMDIDSSRRIESEKRKHQACKYASLARMASGIAHKLNNIVMVARSYQQMAEESITAGSPALDPLLRAGRTMDEIKEFCAAIQLFTGRSIVITLRLDLNQIVQSEVERFQTVVPDHISVRFSPCKTPLIFSGDLNTMRKMLNNLLSNAMLSFDKSDPGRILINTGRLSISPNDVELASSGEILPAGQYVFFEVSDTGCGMNCQTLSNIFDPFYSYQFKGQGLGMAEVFGILRAHKGFASLNSRPGKGTTIRVMLPAIQNSPERSESNTSISAGTVPSDQANDGKTILVIDEQEAILNICRRILTVMGFHVLTTTDGRTGIEQFHDHMGEIACVIIDLNLPAMNGTEIMTEIRQIDPGVRLIVTSGCTEGDFIEEKNYEQPDAFIPKPFDKQKFKLIVSAVLSGHTSKQS